jgi:hypothetical protein
MNPLPPPSDAPATQSIPLSGQEKGKWNKSKASRSNGAEIQPTTKSRPWQLRSTTISQGQRTEHDVVYSSKHRATRPCFPDSDCQLLLAHAPVPAAAFSFAANSASSSSSSSAAAAAAATTTETLPLPRLVPAAEQVKEDPWSILPSPRPEPKPQPLKSSITPPPLEPESDATRHAGSPVRSTQLFFS